MLETFAQLSLYGLIILIGYNILKSFVSRDHSQIWNPMVFISLVYFYYVIWPYYWGDTDFYKLGTEGATEYNLIAAFISYLGIHLKFHRPTRKTNFNSINNVFTETNSVKLSVLMLLIGFAGYVSIKGFSMSLFTSVDAEWNKGGDFAFYFTDLISLGCACCSVLAVKSDKKWLIVLAVLASLFFYVLCGFRYRIVMLAIATFTTWHLFPSPKRINYKVLVPIALAAFFLFALMDGARRYGSGLDRDAVANLDVKELKGASENSNVFTFTGYAITKYVDQEKIHFEPLWCAITLPIPRVIFPGKPNAEYIRKVSTYEFGGAAFMYYAEAYMAFGWLGVILYGLFIGWLSRRIWDNYQSNPNNLNAILFMAIFNGTTYVLISRGYMAQALQIFVYFMFLPFWLGRIIKYFVPSFR